jgi:hypothetical protein
MYESPFPATVRYVSGLQWLDGLDRAVIEQAQADMAAAWHESPEPMTWMMNADLGINQATDARSNTNWHWVAMAEFRDRDSLLRFLRDEHRLAREARDVVPHVAVRQRIAFDARGVFRAPGTYGS